MNIIDHAHIYADLGITVHPLLSGPVGSDRSKRPNYDVESTSDSAQLRANLRDHAAGIGGTLPRGMIAIDVDVLNRKTGKDKSGISQLEQLNDVLGVELRSLTRTHLTSSRDSNGHRGQHLFFTVDPDRHYSLIGVARALGLRSTKELHIDLRGNGSGNLVLPGTAGYSVSALVTDLVMPAPAELEELLAMDSDEVSSKGGYNPQHVSRGLGSEEGVPTGVGNHWSTRGLDTSLEAYFGIRICLDMGWTTDAITEALLSKSWAVHEHYKEHNRDWRRAIKADVERIAEKLMNGKLQASDTRSAAEQLAALHDAMVRPAAMKLWRAQPIAERVLLAMTEISAKRKSLRVHAPAMTLARRVGCGRNAAERALRTLKDVGWIRVYDQGGQNRATEWRLAVPAGLARGEISKVARILPEEDSWQCLFGRGGLPRAGLRILEHLLCIADDGVALTRAELTSTLQLSKSVTSTVIAAFLEMGLVEEGPSRAVYLIVDMDEAERLCRVEARRLGQLQRVRRRNKDSREIQAAWPVARVLHATEDLVASVLQVNAEEQAAARAISDAQIAAEVAATREMTAEEVADAIEQHRREVASWDREAVPAV